MKKIICSIWLLFASLVLFSQGSLLLVGGGIELRRGWSDMPYKWAIDQANNKRVAVLCNTSSIGDRLADYFLSLGASSSRSFEISSVYSPNEAWFYDSLMQYDVIFLSRAKVSFYSKKLAGSPIQRAIKDKFKKGGVIGGSAGGSVILGELFLDESKENVSIHDLTTALKTNQIAQYKNFLPLLSDFIIESEFSEKGNIVGTLSCISHVWQREKKQLKGIGIDEKTAICIDKSGKGRIYGMAGVHLFLPSEKAPEYKPSSKFFSNELLHHIQLLNGSIFDFKSNHVQGIKQTVAPPIKEERLKQNVLLSGSNSISDNVPFLQALITSEEQASPILIISDADSTILETLQAVLSSLGVFESAIISPSSQNHSRALIHKFGQAPKVLFVDNDLESLQSFLTNNTYENTSLLQHLQNERRTLAFMGADAQLAGRVVVANYQEKWASYEGELAFPQGLGVFSSMTIMPNAFSNPTYVDNMLTGIPYAMVKDSLLYGLWLYPGSYVVCAQDNGITTIKSYGDNPSLLLKNPGINAMLAPVYRGKGRNIAAFDGMLLALIDEDGTMIGVNQPETIDTSNIKQDWLTVYPNPVKDKLNVLFYGNQIGRFNIQLKDSNGRTLLSTTALITPNQLVAELDVSNIPKGVYALSVLQGQQRVIKKLRVMK